MKKILTILMMILMLSSIALAGEVTKTDQGDYIYIHVEEVNRPQAFVAGLGLGIDNQLVTGQTTFPIVEVWPVDTDSLQAFSEFTIELRRCLGKEFEGNCVLETSYKMSSSTVQAFKSGKTIFQSVKITAPDEPGIYTYGERLVTTGGVPIPKSYYFNLPQTVEVIEADQATRDVFEEADPTKDIIIDSDVFIDDSGNSITAIKWGDTFYVDEGAIIADIITCGDTLCGPFETDVNCPIDCKDGGNPCPEPPCTAGSDPYCDKEGEVVVQDGRKAWGCLETGEIGKYLYIATTNGCSAELIEESCNTDEACRTDTTTGEPICLTASEIEELGDNIEETTMGEDPPVQNKDFKYYNNKYGTQTVVGFVIFIVLLIAIILILKRRK